MSVEIKSIKPIGDKIVLKPEPKQSRIGSIIIPDSAQKSGGYARVVAMGPGMLTKHGRRWPMPDVEIGQRVLIPMELIDHAARFTLNGEEHIVVRDCDILAAD